MNVDNRDGMFLTAFVIALISFASLNFDLALDGAETTYFGFPFPWNSRATAASLGKEIYALPLVLDIMFWTWIGVRVLQFVGRFPRTLANNFRAVLLVLGLVGLGLTILTLAFNELFFSFLPAPGPFQITAVRPGFGA